MLVVISYILFYSQVSRPISKLVVYSFALSQPHSICGSAIFIGAIICCSAENVAKVEQLQKQKYPQLKQGTS